MRCARRTLVRPATVLVLTVLAPLGGCAAPQGETLTVFAAASLSESFTVLGALYTDTDPDVEVTFSFGGSSSLAQQVVAGAPADVFAAASAETMTRVVDAGLTDTDPVVIARNRLQIAVPAGNPGGVTGLGDLGDADLRIALCAAEVPCGAVSRELLAAAGVVAAPDTLERDVKAALTKVELDEVDAALVYRTDVRSAGAAVEGIEVPGAELVVNDYPVTVLAGAPNPQAARDFLDFLRSEQARAVLTDAGFEAPAP